MQTNLLLNGSLNESAAFCQEVIPVHQIRKQAYDFQERLGLGFMRPSYYICNVRELLCIRSDKCFSLTTANQSKINFSVAQANTKAIARGLI